MTKFHPLIVRCALAGLVAAATFIPASFTEAATTELSDIPVFSASSVPANLMLALSVEFPTGTVAAYTDVSGFSKSNVYLGYFDQKKCYTYQSDTATAANNYFVPAGAIPASGACSSTQWSGNLLNWVSMTALDEFRQTLTGGFRSIDTPSLTVLQRARQTAQGSGSNFPTKQFTASAGLVPSTFGTGTVYIRTHNGAELTNTIGGVTDRGVFIQVSNNSGFSNSGSSNVSTLFYARVKVCDSGAGLEDNCTKYSGNYKPEGLIQKNANRIRVGAAGYFNRNGNTQPNGILRAPIRDIGPTKYNGFGTRPANEFKEWDAGTGVFTLNPDPTSATASGVSKSGAINYLNQFGNTQLYMTYDTISELYWAGLSHYMQVDLDASYTSGVTSGSNQYDNFPGLKSTVLDPIQYSCQANSIVVIGDTHTHCDSRVPGGGPDSQGSGSNCANQQPLPVVQGLNAAAYATALGKLPLLEANSGNTYSPTAAVYLPGAYRTALGTQFAPTGAGNATYDIAGMAYFAHTKDIRPDADSNAAIKDKQTVDTFVVDVMEPGSADNSNTTTKATFNPSSLGTGSPGPNQYWLATKYGGFNDIKDDGVPASYLTWHTNTTTGTNTRPDNLFPGNRPDLIRQGLATIFDKISSKKILSAVGPGTSTTRSLRPADLGIYKTTATGFPIYTTKYKPGDWTGDIDASISTMNADGSVTPVTTGTPPVVVSQWSAQQRLDVMASLPDTSTPPKPVGWDTTRRIVTWSGTAGVPFRYTNLTAAQKTALNSDANLLNFLRGDRSNEGTKYRVRPSVLGDIVNSEAVLVQGAQSPVYTDAANPGYSDFRTLVKSRAPVIYAGANDGMLHAFAADFSKPANATDPSGGGSELFAYVPSFLFNGPNGTSGVDGLAALGNLTGVTTNPYAHHFYVDQTPQVADADFNRVSGNADGATGSPDWRTLLVGAVGKGGKGIYALDVTSVPAALSAGTSATQEGLIKSKVLWEFAPADMGYVYGKPNIAKTRKYGWVVLVATGYNNASGVGRLYVLNAKTGTLLETLSTTGGSSADPSGLGRIGAYTQDFSDNTIEQVYVGDLKGKLWRFDLSAASGSYPNPEVFAELIDDSNNPQPITTAPRMEIDVDSTGLGTRRWIFVGTGQFLDVDDLTTTQTQTMYALRDGAAAVPRSTGLPLGRADLKQITDLRTGVAMLDSDDGWYFDLPGHAGGTSDGASERIVVDLDSQAGVPIIAWATLLPTDNPCEYHGAIYAVNYATGMTALLGANGAPITSVSPETGAPTKVAIQQLPDGSLGLLYGSLGGKANIQKLANIVGSSILSRTNWREVLD